MSPENKLINVYIPAYNCQNQIVKVLDKVLDNQDFFNDIYLIDNCSTDKTVHYAKQKENKFGKKLNIIVNPRNLGYGGTHKVIFNDALEKNIDYALVLHGDDQADINDFIPFIKDKTYLNKNALLGARFMSSSKLFNYSYFRKFGNIVFNILYSISLGKKIFDLGSGINLYSKKCFADLNYKKFNDDLTFNYQNTINMFKNINDLVFIPITWREEGQLSNVKIITQTLTVFKILIKYTLLRKI